MALTSAILGMDVQNETLRSGVSDLAWDMSESLRQLSDEVCPNSGAEINGVA
jgi:hypothetical protein